MSLESIGSVVAVPAVPAVGRAAVSAAGNAVPADVTPDGQQAVERSSAARRAAVEQASRDLASHYSSNSNTNLKFRVDDASGDTVVSVVDSQSGELLRQIPSDEALRIARWIGSLRGGLLQEKV